jgi:hypothetical protein
LSDLITKRKSISLEQHKELILSWLRTYPEVTAAQIYDWLQDNYNWPRTAY